MYSACVSHDLENKADKGIHTYVYARHGFYGYYALSSYLLFYLRARSDSSLIIRQNEARLEEKIEGTNIVARANRASRHNSRVLIMGRRRDVSGSPEPRRRMQ